MNSYFSHSLRRRTQCRFEELEDHNEHEMRENTRGTYLMLLSMTTKEFEDEERSRDLSAPFSHQRQVGNEEFIYSIYSQNLS